jgi:hypothetical protein
MVKAFGYIEAENRDWGSQTCDLCYIDCASKFFESVMHSLQTLGVALCFASRRLGNRSVRPLLMASTDPDRGHNGKLYLKTLDAIQRLFAKFCAALAEFWETQHACNLRRHIRRVRDWSHRNWFQVVTHFYFLTKARETSRRFF